MPNKKTVVHIEDDADFAGILDILFADDPINWIIAPTAVKGLQLIQELHPDLVVLDLALPDISGRDIFLQMRADPELSRIPVWVLSVTYWNADRHPWDDPSLISYSTKPLEIFQFRDRILRLLGIERSEETEPTTHSS